MRSYKIQVMENRTLSRNWHSETKVHTHTHKYTLKYTSSGSASRLKNRHQEAELLSAFPKHRRAIIIIRSQRISLSFWPASWERGWKCGCFWSSDMRVCVVRAVPCCACVCICLLVINGGSSNICSFSCWHMTHSQPVFFSLSLSFFSLALIRHKFWPASFLAACVMWLRNGFRHFNTSKKKKKTDYCIHKQLLWRCAHTGRFKKDHQENGECETFCFYKTA